MPQQITVHVHALVEAAEREIETLSANEAVALHGGDGVVFVDLRDIRELNREGRVPGAFHCPRGMLEFWVDPESSITSRSSRRTSASCSSVPPASARRSPPRRRSGWAWRRSPTSPADSAPGKRGRSRSSRRPRQAEHLKLPMTLRLIIGNKNYSSWSFRPWIAMKVAGIAFDEEVISLNAPDFKIG